MYAYLCTFNYIWAVYLLSAGVAWTASNVTMAPASRSGVCSSTAYMCVIRSLQRDLCAQLCHRMIGNVLYLVFTTQNL